MGDESLTPLGTPDPLISQAHGLNIQGNSTQTLLGEDENSGLGLCTLFP